MTPGATPRWTVASQPDNVAQGNDTKMERQREGRYRMGKGKTKSKRSLSVTEKMATG